MTAKEFLALDLQYGDRVRVTLGEAEHEGFFGGYKAFEGSHSCLEYALYPIFYAIGKKGQMVKRSMVPERSPYWGFHTISKIEKVTIRYRWKGYIDNVKDSIDAALRGPKVILNEWKEYRKTGKSAYGFCDANNETTFESVKLWNNITVLDDGEYAVYVFHNKDTAFVRVFERIDDQ